MFLLDANVLSHIAPARRRTDADEALAAWIVSHSDELWFSVITAAEIQDGIAKAMRAGATRKAADLAEWWGEVRHYYPDRILPLDIEVAQEAGRLMDKARAAKFRGCRHRSDRQDAWASGADSQCEGLRPPGRQISEPIRRIAGLSSGA